jgi:hypothetical protein
MMFSFYLRLLILKFIGVCVCVCVCVYVYGWSWRGCFLSHSRQVKPESCMVVDPCSALYTCMLAMTMISVVMIVSVISVGRASNAVSAGAAV